MAMRIEMVRAGEMVDAFSGVCIADTTQTISKYLSNSEIDRYAKAMYKVSNQEAINRKDLIVLDKIDAITYEHHGMCLKDSAVTKARLRACKKYRVQFIDRDGLVEHMNYMMPDYDAVCVKKPNLTEEKAIYFIEKFGPEIAENLLRVLNKLKSEQEFDLAELQLISEMESFAAGEFGRSIVDERLRQRIDQSCKKLGIYFQNLQKVVKH